MLSKCIEYAAEWTLPRFQRNLKCKGNTVNRVKYISKVTRTSPYENFFVDKHAMPILMRPR